MAALASGTTAKSMIEQKEIPLAVALMTDVFSAYQPTIS
jgi:hypothetical protein